MNKKMDKNIALVGFMGSGKTAVGKRLAKKSNLKFVDLDDLIEAKEGMKITQIFKDKGEPHFRKVEKEIVLETAKEKGLVIACGGGVVLDKENVNALKENSIMIYLKVSPELILERTRHYTQRPLLNVDNPKKKIEKLLEYRKEYYEQADYTIDTSNSNIDEVVNKILEVIR